MALSGSVFSEENSRKVVENAPIGILIIDREMKCRFVNQRFCEIVGYLKDELSRMTFKIGNRESFSPFTKMEHSLIKALLLWTFILMSARTFGQEAFVTLQYSDDNAEEQRYFITPTEDGSFNLAKKFTIAPDLDGYVRLRIKLKKPGFVYTSGLDRLLMIYIAPGSDVHVRIEKEVTFSGSLRKENSLANRLVKPRDSGAGQTAFERKFAAIATPEVLMDSLKKEIDLDFRQIQVAVDEERRLPRQFKKSLSKGHLLFNLCQADVAITHRKSGRENVATEGEWQRIRSTLFVDSLVNCGLTVAREYSEYLIRYMDYLGSAMNDLGQHDSLALVQEMRLTDQHLHGIAKEAYMTMFLSINIVPGAPFYSRDLVVFYDNFKKEFPGSAAIPVLKPEIRRIAKLRLPATQHLKK